MSEKSLCGKKKKWDRGIFEVTVKQAVKCSLRPAGHLDLRAHASSQSRSHMSRLSHLAEGEVNLGPGV